MMVEMARRRVVVGMLEKRCIRALR